MNLVNLGNLSHLTRGERYRVPAILRVMAVRGTRAIEADCEKFTRFIQVHTDADLTDVLPDLLAADVLGLDLETTGLDPRSGTLQLVQLATRDRVYLITPANCGSRCPGHRS